MYVCVYVCMYVCVVDVWCSGCVLDSGPKVLSSNPIFHLVFHLHPTSPTKL